MKGKGVSGEGKGKNLSFEIKTKASVTGVTPAAQLHEVKREHQDTKGCSVGSALGINYQPRRKRPQNSLQSQLRGCSTPSPGGAAEGNNAQSCSSQSPGQAPAPFLLPATPDSDTWDLPRGFSWGFSRAGSREAALAVENLGLQQPWVWGVSSIPHFWAVFLGAAGARADPTGMLFLILISSLQELQDRQPWLPVTLAQFFGLPLWTKGTHRGEKSCSSGSGKEGLMPG